MEMYSNFYRGMLDEYDGDDMKLEIKNKYGDVLCGKYGRVDEWKRWVDGEMVEYGDVVNKERRIVMSKPLYLSFNKLVRDLMDAMSERRDENEKD